jgi:ADP-ribosylglycohydrolase
MTWIEVPKASAPGASLQSAAVLGAILGDIVGSVYEGRGLKRADFPLFGPGCTFTDDTVLTVATADAILNARAYRECYRAYGRRYPAAGYGGAFREWMWRDDDAAYGSWANGSAMRVSPVGWAAASEDEALAEAARSSSATHDHADAVAGAQAVALGVFLARGGASREDIRLALSARFGYDLGRRLDDVRRTHTFDVSARGSVPEAVIAFLESDGVEDAVRQAVSLGGDADTQAAIAGALAEAFHGGLPAPLEAEVFARLPPELAAVVLAFRDRYLR